MGMAISGKTRWVLGASLALNLVFVGLFAGAGYRHANGFDPGARAGGPDIRGYGAPYVRALPQSSRQSFGSAMRALNKGPQSRSARRAQYQSILVALRSDPFDESALTAALDQQRSAILDVQAAAQSLWLAEVSGMSPAARADVADRLERMLNRKPGKRRKFRPQPEG